MCITNALQQKIRKHTDNGDLIAQFLADTIRGEYPDAKYHHKFEAAKLLTRYDSSEQPDRQESQFWGLIPTPEELATAPSRHSCGGRNPEGQGGADNPPHPVHPVSYADILNYDIAHLIRQETAEGHTIAEFLSHVMTRRDQPFTPKKLRIRHVDRMAAAREILRRGHGHFGRRRKLVVDDYDDSNDYDTLHTDLAKRMREYNEHGTDAIRFLLDVMNDTSLDPEEGYTWHHKMSAAHEIIRRGWDTNYDKITPEMLQAYWQDHQSTRLSIGQKKQLAGLPALLDEYDQYDTEDYQAIADAIRDQEEREALGTKSLPPRRGKARMGVESPASSASKNPTERENGKQNPISPHSTRHSCESRNPAGQGQGADYDGSENTYSPSTSQRSDEVKQDNTSSASCTSMSVLPDDLDCYYEPLTPEDQAIFNYNSLIESGEFEESEITFVPPSEAARRDYAIALKQIKDAAKAEGVPLLPNPLAGTLHHPNIRSP